MSNIPGSNLLNSAFRVIASQQVKYYRFVSRDKNAAGVYIPSYAKPVGARGSVQPVPRTRYEAMGLDFQKNYVTIFVEKSVIDIARDVAGDLFVYNAVVYHAESKTNWFGQDSWVAVVCVETDDAVPS